jgi:hypothetical protein
MNRSALEYGSAGYRIPANWQAIDRVTCRGNVPIGSNLPKQVPFEPEDHGIVCLTEARSILPYCIQHWLDIGWRAGNNLQHLAGCSLLLERLGQIVSALA